MKKIIVSTVTIMFLAVFFGIPAHASEKDFNKAKKPVFESFMDICVQIMDQLKKPFDAEALKKKADALIGKGVAICGMFGAHESECTGVMDIYVNDSGKMKTMAWDAFDKSYLQFAILKEKGIDIDDEDVEECLEFSTFITHPVAVSILVDKMAKQKDEKTPSMIKTHLKDLYDQISEEIEEEH